MWLQRLTSVRANVGNGERAGSVVVGLGLALAGLTRHRVVGFGLVALGAALVQRGVRGRCPIYGALGIDRSDAIDIDDSILDAVERDSMDSFPASDAPARHSMT